ncbi:hypothetical protein HMPREF2758_04710 [Facklamia sp. HMSC062C11]|uniref:hypothetical protein n=1 Tax=Facklamia sp. HMSC062C11 TaxID=1739262 RepID=UPI0008A52E02|nr:hypothetical protein [Facklamia sp. HMSC062C11]OFL63456.1 hypothetical protein HMPREF2758_04710 [Facklamia sp. HMSC062C11]
MKQLPILLYETAKQNVYVDVYFKDETFWMNQKMMADLFNCSSDNISLHLKNIYKEEGRRSNYRGILGSSRGG